MRKLRFLFVNGVDAHLTVREVLHFFREPSTVAAFAVAAVALFVFQPFPDLAVLPMAEEVVFWGITFPGTFLIYLGTTLLIARWLGRAVTVIGHAIGALFAALLSPELAVALGMDPAATTPADRLLVASFSFIWGVAMEFMIVTYLLPAYLRRLDGRGEELAVGMPGFADTAAFPEDRGVVLLGRPFRLSDLLLVSADGRPVGPRVAPRARRLDTGTWQRSGPSGCPRAARGGGRLGRPPASPLKRQGPPRRTAP